MKRGNVSRLDHRAIFSARREISDEYGGTRDEWVPQFTEWAEVKYLRGGESVMQARLASRSPAILTVRASSDARRITSEWRAVIDGRTYHIREDWRESQDRAWLEMLAEVTA